MTDTDPVREAEFNDSNYRRVEATVRTALRRSGCILPDGVVEALACTVLEEALATRRRVAYMVHVFAEAFDGEVTKEKLERLEMVVLLHQRDADGMAYLPVE